MNDLRIINQQITDLKEKIGREDLIQSNYDEQLNKHKIFEQKIHVLQKEKKPLEKEESSLTRSFLYKIAPKWFPETTKKLEGVKKQINDLDEKIQTLVEKQSNIDNLLNTYKEEQMEIEDSKEQIENLITKAIEILCQNEPLAKDLLDLDHQIKKIIEHIQSCDELLNYKHLIYRSLMKYQSKTSDAQESATLDLYDIPFSGLVKFVQINQLNNKMSDNYTLIAEFNEKLKPLNLRLRCNISGVTNKMNHIFDNAYTDYKSIKEIYRNNKELNDTLQNLKEIEETIINKKEEYLKEIESLKEQRDLLMNGYLS
jgi:uncharacterized coiled-coil DUF342 family protein